MMISLVTVHYNDSTVMKMFVESIVRFQEISHIIVVDNASTDHSFPVLQELGRRYEKVDVIQSGRNGGYGYGNNFGIRYAAEKYHADAVLIANPDVMFEGRTVRRMKEMLDQRAELAAAAPVMKDCRGRISRQTAWRLPKSGWGFLFMDVPLVRYLLQIRYYYPMRKIRSGSEIRADAVAGALLMVRTADLARAGYYDESLFLYCEEHVLAMRLRAIRKKSLLLTDIHYIHNHSTTIRKSYRTLLQKVRLLFQSKEIVLKKYYGFHGLRLWIFYLVRGCCYFYALVRGFFV